MSTYSGKCQQHSHLSLSSAKHCHIFHGFASSWLLTLTAAVTCNSLLQINSENEEMVHYARTPMELCITVLQIADKSIMINGVLINAKKISNTLLFSFVNLPITA